MPGKNIRVLVVDDSVLIREMIGDFIRETPGLEVAGTAADGIQALQVLDKLAPDVVTLDIQMPRMDGLETLEEILKRRPVPVIMVSSLTQLGAKVTLDALDRGAVDYVAKPEVGTGVPATLRDELVRKIKAMAGTDIGRLLRIRKERAEKQRSKLGSSPRLLTPIEGEAIQFADKCIAIGISTGGPPALSSLFEALLPPLPPIVVVQHMPPVFTKPFAWRLDSASQLSIKEAETGDVLRQNHVYIAKGGFHLGLQRVGSQVRCVVKEGDFVSGHRPSVDVMMKCAAEIFRKNCLGVIMTGMGRDGADGCGAIKQNGGYVLGQDEASSDVYGMNKVAFVEGHVHEQFHLDDAASVITDHVRRLWARASLVTAR